MNAQLLFWIIVAIQLFEFGLAQVLGQLNSSRRAHPIPDILKDVYDEEQYKKQQAYRIEKHRFGIVADSVSLLLVLLMFIFEGFAFVDTFARQCTEHPIWVTLIFFGGLAFAASVLSLPFSYYGTFVIEEKFGFNNTTNKTFFLDVIKSWLLMAVLGGGLLALIVWLYQLDPARFWLYAWGALSLVTVWMTMFFSTIIVPIFNKQQPLPEGELRTSIQELCQTAGFELQDVYVIDGSKRSTKANAYFSGFGVKKRIVLYDTLVSTLSRDQVVAVLAHEIGHYKKKHTVSGLVVSILQTGLALWGFSLLAGNPMLSEALGIDVPGFHVALVVYGLLYSPVSLTLGVFGNALSRTHELAADQYAAEMGEAEHLASALKQLASENLSNLTPHPAYVFFHYSHPPLVERIGRLRDRYSPAG